METWTKKETVKARFRAQLSGELRQAIFLVFYLHTDLTLLLGLFRIFDLKSESDRSPWAESLRLLLRPPKVDVRRVIQLVVALDLVGMFSLQEVAIPAVLLGCQPSLYDDYLLADKQQAEAFVRWLDSFMTNNLDRINQTTSQYRHLTPSGKLELVRLRPKSVEKFIKSCLEKYDVSHTTAPEYTRQKTMAALRYEIKHGMEAKRE